MKVTKRMSISAMLVLILTLSLITPIFGQTPITRFGTVIIKVLTVTNGLTSDDVTTTDDLVVGDDATVTDDLNVTDDALLNSDLTLVPQSVITLTMNATLTPVGSFTRLASSGTVNTSSITAGTAGDVLVLYNTTNTSIVFSDTGTLKLSGNITLGQNDSLTLVADGTNWVQLATSNN